MNSNQRNRLYRGLLLAALSMFSLTTYVAPVAAASVQVMDVDDVRDAAKIARAKAKNLSEDGGSDGGGGFGSGGGECGSLNIGNVQTSVGQPVPREVTIVIEGPVINADNRCR